MSKTVNNINSTTSADKGNSYEISFREKLLRRKLDYLDESSTAHKQRMERSAIKKRESLEKKIVRSRNRQESIIDRRSNSKLYANHPRIYNLLQPFMAVGCFARHKILDISDQSNKLKARRPHRSFYVTTHKQSKRSIKMPGYFGFVGQVWLFIWDHKWIFAKFLLLYAVISAVIVGMLSQSNFVTFRDSLEKAGADALVKVPALLSQAITAGSGTTDSGQQIMSVLLFLYGWLTLIWLMRQLVNGNKVKLRDGLYGSGSPVIAILAIVGIIILQIIPLSLALLAYSSVTAVGWINNGIAIENMAAWCTLALVAALTLYWMSSSILSLIIVTLPGMYPMKALKAAGDLVVGRRLSILLRLIMMAIPVLVIWLIILLPAVLIDSALKLTWQPLVPLVVLILSTVTLIWCAVYTYLLYRNIIDDPTPIPTRILSNRQKLRGFWSKRGQNASANSGVK